MWRYRGTRHYLDQQAKRLGITPVLADRCRHNQEIYRVSVLLAQLSERYHKARKEDGKAVLLTTELEQIKGTLLQCEQALQKLHLLAATSEAMLDEAWCAFGPPVTKRPFVVRCDHDHAILPVGDGTVGLPLSPPGGGTNGEGETLAETFLTPSSGHPLPLSPLGRGTKGEGDARAGAVVAPSSGHPGQLLPIGEKASLCESD
jgi:hypothetical protein